MEENTNETGLAKPEHQSNNDMSTQMMRRKLLKPYFEAGFSPENTLIQLAGKGNLDIRKIRNYFRGWADELSQQYSAEIFEREKEIRGRASASYEALIIQLRDSLNDINGRIQRIRSENEQLAQAGKVEGFKEVPLSLHKQRAEIIAKIESILEKKFTMELTPTMDEETTKQIEKYVREERERLTRGY